MPNRKAATFAVAVSVAAALVLTGCSDDHAATETTTSPSDVPTSTITETSIGTSVETTTGRPTITGAVPDRREASAGAQLTITDVRVGSHDGFDRVVFVLEGTGTPGWIVDYTDAPVQQGSGLPIEVPGTSVLQVALTGIEIPRENGPSRYSGPNPVAGTGAITQVRVGTVFEGQSDAFIGLTSERPAVQVSALSSPTRVVVDVAK